MDWADDVTYAVHDLEDFYRAGIVPLDRLRNDDKLRHEFADAKFDLLVSDLYAKYHIRSNRAALEDCLEDLLQDVPMRPFEGTKHDRALIAQMRSGLITRYLQSFQIALTQDSWKASIRKNHRLEVEVLKAVTFYFVIGHPNLAAQQHGQRLMINRLFQAFSNAIESESSLSLFPLSWREEAFQAYSSGNADLRSRMVIDFLASLTERQILGLHARLYGAVPGSLHDHLV